MGNDMAGAPNVHEMAFPGDPGHEAGMKPMMGLKGGCSSVNVQAPSLQESNTGSAVGSPSDTSGDITGWNNTILANTGGAHNHTTDGPRSAGT